MNCDRIKEKLNEYIEDTLPAHWKDLVREHLSTCANCSEELESLKAYLETLGSLEKIEAPENFLKSVHERLERKQGFKFNLKIKKDVVQKIFAPFKKKLTLKIAGAVVIVFLVIFIAKIMQQSGQMPTVATLPKGEIAVDEAVKEKKETPLAIEAKKDKTTADSIVSKSKPVELILLIKPESESAGYKTKGLLEAAKLSAAESPVENLVESFGGTILSVKYDEPKTQIISAEISRDKYSDLLKSLDELKAFQKPAPSVIGKEGDSIKIRVKLAPSD
jgi:hypothetical protein